MTTEEKKKAVNDAVKAAIDSLQENWKDEGETQHFAVTVHNQDQSLFAEGDVSL